MILLLQFLIIYLPFQIALNISENIDLASGRVLILVIFLLWLVISLKKRDFKIPFGLEVFFLYLFAFFCFFSLVKAEMILWGLRKLMFLANTFLLFFIFYSLINKKNFKKILDSFSLVLLIVSVFGFFQFISQFILGADFLESFYKGFVANVFWGSNFGSEVASNPSWFVELGGKPVFRAISIFPDPHNFAMFLGLLSPIMICYSFYLRKKRESYLLPLFSGSFSILMMLLSFSRGSYLGILFSFFVVFWFLKEEKFFLKFLFIILIFSFILLIIPNFLTIRFFSSFDFQEGSVSDRLLIWKEALAVIKDNFILGTGLGNYALIKGDFIDYRNASNAHNLYLDIWSEIGIFGLLFFVLFFIFLIKRNKKNIPKSDFNKFLNIGFIGSFVYFLVHSFFETAIFSPVNMPMLIILIASSLKLNINDDL